MAFFIASSNLETERLIFAYDDLLISSSCKSSYSLNAENDLLEREKIKIKRKNFHFMAITFEHKLS